MTPPDNKSIYDKSWSDWHDMKVRGPASRWLRYLIFDVIEQNVRPSDVHSVLDVGCGEGTTTYGLATIFEKSRVLGVDFSQRGVQVARTHYSAPNLEFKHDETNAALRSSFDLITAFEVLEHIEEWKPFLDTICYASNRYVLLSFPTGRMRSHEIEVGHFRNYQRGEVESYMRSKGFRPVCIYYAGFPFFSPLYRELCQIRNPASTDFVRGSFGPMQKLVATVFYILFRHLSTKRRLGDQFCGLFERV